MALFIWFTCVVITTVAAASPVVNAKKCTQPHERYSSCLLGECRPKTCDDVGKPIACPGIASPCAGGCICKEGFVRNSNGDCVDQMTCPKKCTQPHERYSSCLLGECRPKTCDDVGKPIACPGIASPCAGGCICEEGFVRNSNGDCVDQMTCPIKCTQPHERYSSCLLGECRPKTCDDVGKPIACPGIASPCAGGCICEEGFVRNSNGDCVDQMTCHFANCGANETFVPCTFRCPQVMCPESDLTLLCKPPRDCPGGCGCKPNFKYNSTGDCILGSECPPVECTRPNEEWAACRSAYDYERCEDRYNSPPIISQPGDDECNPRCTCTKGYYKNDSNECVSEKDCPSVGS